MAYNYNNPYQQYPYTNNYGYQQQPMQQNMQQAQYNPYAQNPNVAYQQQAPQVQPQQQTNYLPLTFVSGVEGAKAFIVPPNQTVYLRDSDTETLFIKTADAQGRYTLKTYNLTPTDGTAKPSNIEFATIEALNAVKHDFEERLNKLSIELEKAIGGRNNEQ